MRFLAVALVVVSLARGASADDTKKKSGHDFKINRVATISFIVGGGIVWAASDRLFQDTIAPKSCRIICEDRVNPFDRIVGEDLKWKDDKLPQTLSDLAAYVIIPAVGFGGLSAVSVGTGYKHQWFDDMLVVAETTVVVGLVNRATALTFGRTRPRTVNHPPGTPVPMDRQAHESFFSGHTSAAFSMGVAAAVVADIRDYRVKGHRIAPYMWASALIFGTATGYFRLAGADHWTTDVLTGAAVATGLSIIVPHLHEVVPVTVAPTADGGATAGVSFTF